MAIVNIFSAGAAQSVVARLVSDFQGQHDCTIHATYGGVLSLKSRILKGEPADVIVLTNTLIDELEADAVILAGSRADLGAVGTGVAVRAGMPRPDVSSLPALRATLLGCSRLICPDPAATTAGQVLLSVLSQLGINEQLQPRLELCASGHHAMIRLAAGIGEREIGVVQMTEILANGQVTLAGPLPEAVQHLAVYSVGQASQAASPALAKAFIRQLTRHRDTLQQAGFFQVPSPTL